MKIWCETCKGSGVFRSDLGPIMCDHCNGKGYTENESIDELKIKADKWDEKETPKEVIDEDGITFSCPTCYADNSKWIDWSMLQRQPKRAKVCQECGQKLDWSE